MSAPRSPSSLRIQDVLLFVLALLPSVVVAGLFYDFSLPPFEDAAMLMRYAGHLAAGKGIVWNPGDAPVDGATDFLFMVMTALVHKAGLSLEQSVRVLSVAAHLLTLWLVFRINVRMHGSGPWLAAASVAFLALGPGLMYLESYFGTPVFALAGLLAYRAYLRMQEGEVRRATAWGFAFWSLIAGLIRPEGVLLAGVMLLGLVAGKSRGGGGTREIRRVVLPFGWVFGLLGGSYFAWHWWYFGHPLPNPFYVKGGGLLHPSSLRASILNTITLGLPLWPLFLYGMWKQRMRPQVILLLTPVAGFTLIWVLMSNAMNYGMRFQYVLAPILMVAWVPVLRSLLQGRSRSVLLRAAGVGLTLMALVFQFVRYHYQPRMFPDGRVELAQALAPYAHKGYTMAVTEAGNLPLYSRWRAIDTWGLNDRFIAHYGIVTAEYLDRDRPELIMIHDYWSPGHARRVPDPKWAEMTAVLEAYLAAGNYELVACYGAQPDNAHFYYLLRDFEDYREIRELIRRLPYPWYENGRQAVDFTSRQKE